MSAIVQARLFLTAEGTAALPALVAQHRRAAAAVAGFIALRRLQPRAGGDMVLELEFATALQLTQWRASPQHQQLGREYRRYSRQEPEVRFFDVAD